MNNLTEQEKLLVESVIGLFTACEWVCGPNEIARWIFRFTPFDVTSEQVEEYIKAKMAA